MSHGAERARPSAARTQALYAWEKLGSKNALWVSSAIVLLYRAWLYLAFARYTPRRGDENFYWRTSQHVLHILGVKRVPNQDFEGAVDQIVSRGWFLPGMSTVLAPARIFTDSPQIARLWVGLISIALLYLVVRQLWQMFSPSVAVVTLLVIGLLPYTAWFSFTLWGGHIGGSIMVLNLLWVIRMARDIRAGRDPRLISLVLLGLSVTASVYIRPPTLGQLLPIAGLLFFAYASRSDGTFWVTLKRSVPRWGLVFLVFVIAFAPWQYALFRKFDGPFLVVTSRPLAQILRFADDEEKAVFEGRFDALYNHLEELAEERDQGFYDVAISERDRVVRDVSLGERLTIISAASRRFFDFENEFIRTGMIRATEDPGFPTDRPTGLRLTNRVTRVNSLMWLGVTIVAIYALLRRWKIWDADGYLGIVLRGSMVMALFQPLNGGPHGRHISFLVLMFVVASAIAVDSRLRRSHADTEPTRWPDVERWVANVFSAGIIGFLAFYFIT